MNALIGLVLGLTLPRHAESPSPGHVTLSAGIQDLQPTVGVRIGLVDWWDLRVDGVWFEDAPLLGAQMRFAVGGRDDNLFAHVWTEGHLRPLFAAEVISGFDLGGGIGLVGLWRGLSVRLDGGLAVGVALERATAVDATAVDQQGGLFGLQRLRLGWDLLDWLAVAGSVAVAIPFGELDPADDGAEVVRAWDLVLGTWLAVRI